MPLRLQRAFRFGVNGQEGENGRDLIIYRNNVSETGASLEMCIIIGPTGHQNQVHDGLRAECVSIAFGYQNAKVYVIVTKYLLPSLLDFFCWFANYYFLNFSH